MAGKTHRIPSSPTRSRRPSGDSSDFLFFDKKLLDFGKELNVVVGDQSLFKGKVTGIEARFPQGNSPSIVVLAEDRFQDLRMTRRTRTFSDVSDSDVFSQIAGDHGLTPSVTVSGGSYKVLAQLNQSDLAFMRERARALDAELWVTDATLSVKPRADRGGSPVTLTYGKELREFRVLADLALQATSLEVSGLKRRARRFVVGHGTAETRAELKVGATVKLAGLGPLFQGDFYVAETLHMFDGAQGMRTEFEVERPALGRPS